MDKSYLYSMRFLPYLCASARIFSLTPVDLWECAICCYSISYLKSVPASCLDRYHLWRCKSYPLDSWISSQDILIYPLKHKSSTVQNFWRKKNSRRYCCPAQGFKSTSLLLLHHHQLCDNSLKHLPVYLSTWLKTGKSPSKNCLIINWTINL